MPRRGENIYKRKDGRWEGRVKSKETGAGRSKYKSFYGKTYKEVKEKMENYRKEQPDLDRQWDFKMKEAAARWLKERKVSWKSTTYEIYRQIVDKYVIPGLGSLRVSEIDDSVMEGFGDWLCRQKEGELSHNYRFYICSVAQRVLIYMRKKYVKCIQIPLLPLSRQKKSRIDPPGDQVLSVLEEYIWDNKEDAACLGIAIALYTGLRIGELCGLKWEDVDLKEKVIRVNRNIQRVKIFDGQKNRTEIAALTPTTADSARSIPISPRLFELLADGRKEKAGFVLTGVKKPWMDPRTLQYRFKRILQKCGVDYFNFHMLRHAFATRCIAMGFDTKSLSEILGHSSVQITLSLYVHPTMQQKKRLMEQFIPYGNPENQAAG